ncbi:MAG TPA: hypothetical protein VGK33_21525 [Chloroflexota bacterium]|jgi:hypothetical protein
MPFEDSVLYEQFVDARLKAVELTDTYRQAAVDDPRRAVLWEGVVSQTELARGLLESWLCSEPGVAAGVARVTANTAAALR